MDDYLVRMPRELLIFDYYINALNTSSRMLDELIATLKLPGNGIIKQIRLNNNMVVKLIKVKDTGCNLSLVAHILVRIT